METFGAGRGAEGGGGEGIISKSNKRFGKVAGQVNVNLAVLVQSWFWQQLQEMAFPMGMKGLTMAGLAQSVEHFTAEWKAQFLGMCQYWGS